MSNKYSCDMIQDLLALYHDGVCSAESRAAVEQHLSECEACSSIAKQLDNSEIEENISRQAHGVIKNHGRKQRRKLVAVIACALAAVLAITFFWVILPRIQINSLIRAYFPEVGDGARNFTGYDVTDSALVEYRTEGYTIGIPASFEKDDEVAIDTCDVYRDKDNKDLSVILIYPEELDMSIYNRDSFGDNISDEDYERIVSTCRKWFDALGNGQPDSAYGVFKCCHLLSDDDKSFWNVGQNIAFGITAALSENVVSNFGDAYIYETDDKCGIVSVKLPSEKSPYYYFTVDMFPTDNLDKPHALLIRTETPGQGYAIINSIKFD